MPGEQPEPRGWTPIQDARFAANFLVLTAQVLAAPVEVFLRVRFGRHYFGAPSAIALLAIPMWHLFWPGEDPDPLMAFWLLFIVMQLRARIEGIAMVARGDVRHTRFNGEPRLARVFKKMPQEKIKANIEPLVVIGVGVGLLEYSPPLGSYLIAAGCSLAVVAGVIEKLNTARALQLHDVWLEKQHEAERFREFMGGRR